MAKPTGHRARKDRSLRRRVAFRTPKRTFLVFCEGTRTEPDYLKALRQEPAVRDSASVDIRIDQNAGGAVPLTLVEAAAEAQDRNSQEQGEVDEVWCLFDVEWPQNHPKLPEAIARAEVSDVRLAISRALTAKHAGDGTEFPDDNPSSGMYLFLQAIASNR